MDRRTQLVSIQEDARRMGELTGAAPTGRCGPVRTGPVVPCERTRRVSLGTSAPSSARAAPRFRPSVEPVEAESSYDTDLTRLVDALRDTPPDAPSQVWSITSPVAGFWVRRAVHELAVHG